MRTERSKLKDLMDRIDWTQSDNVQLWREALTIWAAAFVEASEQVVAAKSVLAEIMVSGDTDRMRQAMADLREVGTDIEEMMAQGALLDRQYFKVRDYL
jgi:hypothetical protein